MGGRVSGVKFNFKLKGVILVVKGKSRRMNCLSVAIRQI